MNTLLKLHQGPLFGCEGCTLVDSQCFTELHARGLQANSVLLPRHARLRGGMQDTEFIPNITTFLEGDATKARVQTGSQYGSNDCSKQRWVARVHL
jgi:hypothetical protein